MNGCCADKACNAGTCMDLPEALSGAQHMCGDCVHITRCLAFGFTAREATSCDFYPRRFRLPVLIAEAPND